MFNVPKQGACHCEEDQKRNKDCRVFIFAPAQYTMPSCPHFLQAVKEGVRKLAIEEHPSQLVDKSARAALGVDLMKKKATENSALSALKAVTFMRLKRRKRCISSLRR